ncbi:hypothetical protein AOLI_G00227900 [Acnodon oligacanthus]
MRCVRTVPVAHSSGNTTGEMQEELGPEPNHSALNLQVTQAPNPRRTSEHRWNMTTIIISLAAERFGLEEKRAVNLPYTMNNRVNKIHQLRQELKSLRRRFKEAKEEEMGPLAELCNILHKKLMTEESRVAPEKEERVTGSVLPS